MKVRPAPNSSLDWFGDGSISIRRNGTRTTPRPTSVKGVVSEGTGRVRVGRRLAPLSARGAASP